jgi:hypothetical protein
MDSHARLRQTLEGAGCTVCGAAIDIDRVRLLAQREDLCFVELGCRECGSTCIGIVTFPTDDPIAPGSLDVPGGIDGDRRRRPSGGEFTAHDIARLSGGAPVGLADVLSMRRLLAEHSGDLRSLVEDEPGSSTTSP